MMILDGKEIVMIDDDSSDLDIAKVCYQRSGLSNKFKTMRSGEDFLNYLNDCADQGDNPVGLGLIDINMPLSNGFEIISRIRQDERFKHFPHFVILSNSDSHKDRDTSIKIGASEFFSKPTSVQEYVEIFNYLAKKYS